MLPLRDDNPTEITPFVTVLLIGLNAAAWLLVQGAGTPQALTESVVTYGTYPCEIVGTCDAPGPRWESLLTAMFLHGSWEHVIGNMLFLWVFGNNIEDSMGHVRFVVFYLICGLAAGLAHVFLAPGSTVPAVGASGAISGIMGAYIVLYPRAEVRTWVPPLWIMDWPAWVMLGWWFAIQFFSGVVSLGVEAGQQGGVAFWAHVGGFVAGVALIRLFEKPRLVEAKRRHERLPPDEVARLEW